MALAMVGAANGLAYFVVAEGVALQVGEHDLVIMLGEALNHGFAPLFDVGEEGVGDVGFAGEGVAIVGEVPGTAGDEIDDALELLLGANGNLDRHGDRAQANR